MNEDFFVEVSQNNVPLDRYFDWGARPCSNGEGRYGGSDHRDIMSQGRGIDDLSREEAIEALSLALNLIKLFDIPRQLRQNR